MITIITELCFVLGVCYLSLRCIRFLVVPSPLSNIPGPPGGTFIKGHFDKIFQKQSWKFHQELAENYGAVSKIKGFFGAERLVVSDPTALHHIVVKDQDIYEESTPFLVMNKLVLGTSLLSTLGEQHRKQRKMLNPVFSPRHMRDLTPIFYPIAKQLREILKRKVESGDDELDMSSWLGRAAMEYIGQGGMGYTFNSLEEGKPNRYYEASKGLANLFGKVLIVRSLIPYLVKLGSPGFRRMVVDYTPISVVQRLKEAADILYEESVAVYESKKKALKEGEDAVVQQVGKGKDILSVLLRTNSASASEDRLPDEEVLGQINTFIFAGHDTTTLAISRILHQLCLNQDVQDKLREEVTTARRELGDLDYDALMALPLLDAVCRETMRCFPPIGSFGRTVRKDIVLPLMFPIKSVDGKAEIREIPLKKGTGVVISIFNANHSKAIWGEDADEWKPERWLGKSPDEVAKAKLPGVYSSMMTFLGGGRACIGFKFSELEMKIVLSILLESFKFSLGTKEIEWITRGMASPVIKDSVDLKRSMPLKLSLV